MAAGKLHAVFSTLVMLTMLQRCGAVLRDTFCASLFGRTHVAAMAAMRDAVTGLVFTAIGFIAVFQWWKRHKLAAPLQRLQMLWLR